MRCLIIAIISLTWACQSTEQPNEPHDGGGPHDSAGQGHQDGRGVIDSSRSDGGRDGDAEAPVPQSCRGSYLPADLRSAPAYPALVEASGLVASRSRTDLLWLHNDSGDDPILYGVGTDGRRRGRLTVSSNAIDWEDLATARCPDGEGDCLWIADVGDNRQVRSQAVILAVREPREDGDQVSDAVWSFPFQYPGGAVNSEALVVAPEGDQFWVFEKIDGEQARVFQHPGPLVEGQLVTLDLVFTLNAPGVAIRGGRMVTGAALHPSGERVLIRTYTGSFEYRLDAPLQLASMNEQMPVTVSFGPITEPQGEAIAYDETGRSIWTISEDPEQERVQSLHFYGCAP